MPKLLTLALLVTTACLFSNTATADEVREKVKEKCALNFPTDEAARGYCLEQQYRAINELVLLRDLHPEGSGKFNILARCFSKWTKDGFTDWEMVVYCIKEQI